MCIRERNRERYDSVLQHRDSQMNTDLKYKRKLQCITLSTGSQTKDKYGITSFICGRWDDKMREKTTPSPDKTLISVTELKAKHWGKGLSWRGYEAGWRPTSCKEGTITMLTAP